jgi:hypothetical protein
MPDTATRSVPTNAHDLLHQRMLNTGYSTRDIAKVESALLSARLHDTYLRAGYSPDDVAAITSLY